jgi:AraC-like DNA-binding protein
MDWSPERVEFAYPRPKSFKEYERIFRCDLRFEAPISKIVIPRVFWESPLPSSNPDLLKVLEDHAKALLSQHPPPEDSEAKLRSLIGSKLHDGVPCLKDIAREMGFSVRNLQRKLKSINRSYGQILDGMRSQMAKYYLRDPEVPVGEIAGIVGFEEVSSFTRAFKRWTGVSPSEYRKNIGASQ